MANINTQKENEHDLKFREKALNDNMWKVVLSVGTPLALYHGLQQVFTILDTIMAAHISSKSVSAVAYLAQIITIIQAVGSGLAIGGSIQVSNAFGKGDYELVKKRVSTLYLITALIDILMLVTTLPFVNQILVFSGLPNELIALSTSYFKIQIINLSLTFFNTVYISIERARGNSKRILYLNLMVILSKLGLTAYFVYILNGDLVMLAYATLISNGLLFIFSLRNIFDRHSMFGFDKKMISFSRQVSEPMINKSLPITIEKALFAFGKTIVNSMSTIFGDTMVGAIGVSNNLGGITTNPQNGFQEGSSSIIAQNFGAGKYKRVIEAFWITAVIAMVLGGIISGLELVFLSPLADLFAKNDPQFKQLIMMVYSYEAFGAVPLGMNTAVMSLLFGLGKTKHTLVINVARVFVFRIPVFYLLINYTSLGMKSCGYIMLISNVGVSIFAFVIALIVLRNFKQTYLLS